MGISHVVGLQLPWALAKVANVEMMPTNMEAPVLLGTDSESADAGDVELYRSFIAVLNKCENWPSI